MENTRNIVRLLIVDKSSILLAKVKKKGFYFLPGGGIEYNESLESAAGRELLEELGIAPSNISHLQTIGVFEHVWDDNGSPFHEMNFVCACQIQGLQSKIAVESEEPHLEFEWRDISDFNEIDLRPEQFKSLIPSWVKSATSSNFFSSSMTQ